MEMPDEIPPGFFDNLLSGVPEEFRVLVLVGIGLFVIALVLKLIGAAIKAILSVVVLAALAALFVFITHEKGWIDWPFYDGETIQAPDLPDLPTREELEDLADKLPDPPTRR